MPCLRCLIVLLTVPLFIVFVVIDVTVVGAGVVALLLCTLYLPLFLLLPVVVDCMLLMLITLDCDLPLLERCCSGALRLWNWVTLFRCRVAVGVHALIVRWR